jgi:hypothetical protein
MAARKRSARKKATRKKGALRKKARDMVQDLPTTLAAFRKEVRSRLNQAEKELDRANAQARRRLARLIRDGSHLLGRLEERGPAQWRKLTTPVRRDAQRLLANLARAVGGKGKKKARRKKATTQSKQAA